MYKVSDGETVLRVYRTKKEAVTYLRMGKIGDLTLKDAGFKVYRVNSYGESIEV